MLSKRETAAEVVVVVKAGRLDSTVLVSDKFRCLL
jgi:hypothetical protein